METTTHANTRALRDALKACGQAIKTRTTLPILYCVKLVASGGTLNHGNRSGRVD